MYKMLQKFHEDWLSYKAIKKEHELVLEWPQKDLLYETKVSGFIAESCIRLIPRLKTLPNEINEVNLSQKPRIFQEEPQDPLPITHLLHESNKVKKLTRVNVLFTPRCRRKKHDVRRITAH